MSSAAQRDLTSEIYLSGSGPGSAMGAEDGTALRQLAAERLAAHRSRRAVAESREAQARREQTAAQSAVRLQARIDAARAEVHPDASRVREAVAARYEQSVSYREFLAEEAQRTMERAQAEAEVAARNARAVTDAQRKLLEEIEHWNQPATTASVSVEEFFSEAPLEVVEARAVQAPVEERRVKSRAREERMREALPSARLQVRLPEEMELPSPAATFYVPAKSVIAADEELAGLEEEIEFRRAPEFQDMVLETLPIQANIIEFPRQLVASRKARPRLAEGPLREDGTPEPQLRIFEVEQEQISVEPEIDATADAPEWQGLLLSAGSAAQTRVSMSPQLEAQLQLDHLFYAAPVGRRLLSIAVDALCIGAGLAGAAAVAVKIAGDVLYGMALPLSFPLLGGAAAGTLVAFTVMYQLLFFTLNEATPGMRAARIAFCTYSEKSPTRKAMRRRLLSTALAACPLGLGLVWTALDSDRLGWHDRMSRMYPREY